MRLFAYPDASRQVMSRTAAPISPALSALPAASVFTPSAAAPVLQLLLRRDCIPTQK